MTPNMTPVLMRGHLGKRFGIKPRLLDIASPAEAIQALCATVPGFDTYLRESQTRFRMLVKDQPVSKEHLHAPTGRQEIRIVPVVKGAKSDGMQFLEGAALIALAYVTMGGSELGDAMYAGLQGAGMSASGIAGASNFALAIGASMALGGVSRMLAGSPNAAVNTNSALFSGASNTVAQGIPVPVLYGEFYVTPPLISEAIDTELFTPGLFNSSYDGVGTWSGDGSTAAWGASLSAM